MRDKKGIGGFFSGLLYEDESSTNETPTAQPEQPAVQSSATATVTQTRTVTPTATQTVVATPETQAAVSKVNEEMHQSLLTLIEENNIDGFDYLEFIESVQKMSAVSLPENEKYKLVYSTAQSFGVTVDKLVDAVDHYLKVLAKHKDGFQAHVNSQVENEVNERKKKIELLEKQTQELNAKIAEITQQIASNTTEISTLNQEAAQQEIKINMVAQDFNTTYEHVVNRMQTDKEKLRSYLGQ